VLGLSGLPGLDWLVRLLVLNWLARLIVEAGFSPAMWRWGFSPAGIPFYGTMMRGAPFLTSMNRIRSS
jgi:hypothetical protein